MTAAEYAQQLKDLLPPGKVWNLEADSNISKTMLATGDELARVDARGVDLIEESDPRTADETIEDWESMLSLPDERVTVIAATLAERRIAVTQKYVAQGGQDVEFFTRLALACGYTLQPAGTLATPVVSSIEVVDTVNGFLLGATNHRYFVTALNDTGETLPGESTALIPDTGTDTNVIRIEWAKVVGATGYRIWGRDKNASEDFLIAQVTDIHTLGVCAYEDDGSITPAAAVSVPEVGTATVEPITRFAGSNYMMRAGFRAGDRCYGLEHAYAMQLNVSEIADVALNKATFERVIRHAAHAHLTGVLFNYL